MRTIDLSHYRTTEKKHPETKAKAYPKSPCGCRSLEEFSDTLEEAILKKI